MLRIDYCHIVLRHHHGHLLLIVSCYGNEEWIVKKHIAYSNRLCVYWVFWMCLVHQGSETFPSIHFVYRWFIIEYWKVWPQSFYLLINSKTRCPLRVREILVKFSHISSWASFKILFYIGVALDFVNKSCQIRRIFQNMWVLLVDVREESVISDVGPSYLLRGRLFTVSL